MHSDFKELLSALNAQRVKYLIVGAYAVAVYAQPGATKDLDILVRRDSENAAAIYAALAELGAPLEGFAPADLVEPGSFFRMGREPVAVDIFRRSRAWSLTLRGIAELRKWSTQTAG